MKLDSLRCLAEIAKTGSITKTAERLLMTKSALSMIIKNLENELDVALLKRSTRGVELTAAGEMVLEKANLIFALIDQIEAEAWIYRNSETTDEIRYYMTASFANDMFPAVLKKLRTITGGANIVTETCGKTAMIEAVKKDKYNIGFLLTTYDDINEIVNEPDIVVNKINQCKLYAVTAKYSKHVAENKRKLTQDDMRNLPVINHTGKNIEVDEEYRNNLPKKAILTTDNMNIYVQAILEDIGVGYLSNNLILRDSSVRNLLRFLPLENEFYNTLYLLTNKDCPHDLRAKHEGILLEITKSYFEDER